MIRGYKGFYVGGITKYGQQLEVGRDYSVDGPLKVGIHNQKGNGFHMCERMEDVFYFFPRENFIIAEVLGSDENIKFDQTYWGLENMYTCRSIRLVRFLTREEMINHMLGLSPHNNTIFIMNFSLTDSETDLFLDRFRGDYKLFSQILFYQKGYKNIYELDADSANRIVKSELKRIDEQKGKSKIIEY